MGDPRSRNAWRKPKVEYKRVTHFEEIAYIDRRERIERRVSIASHLAPNFKRAGSSSSTQRSLG
jgi:hypothetical protein